MQKWKLKKKKSFVVQNDDDDDIWSQAQHRYGWINGRVFVGRCHSYIHTHNPPPRPVFKTLLNTMEGGLLINNRPTPPQVVQQVTYINNHHRETIYGTCD